MPAMKAYQILNALSRAWPAPATFLILIFRMCRRHKAHPQAP